MTSATTPTASDQVAGIAALAAVAAAPMLLAGCGLLGEEDGGDGRPPIPPLPPALVITSITVSATTDNPATITIDGVADADGAADTTGSATFVLDGAAGTVRAADAASGLASATHRFAIAASAGMESAAAICDVVFDPAPEQAIALGGAAIPRIRHLFQRTCFGTRIADLLRWTNVPYATMVDRLLTEADPAATAPAPGWIDEPVMTWQEVDALSPADRDALDKRIGDRLTAIYAWWWHELIAGRQPLLERMALFWSNHFVTNAGEVFKPQATWRYLDTLRRHALGNFRDLLRAIARDAAMVSFLDSNSNVKGKPNENFARELLELFTLGEGQGYTEQDVVEVARCFTGWGLSPRCTFEFHGTKHDTTAKTVLGATIVNPVDQGMQDGEDVLARVLALPRSAVFICEKLWDEFVGGPRDATVIGAWATTFRSSGYEIKPLMAAVLTSLEFTAAASRGAMVRSPVELHAGLWRSLELEPKDYGGLHWLAGQEDQALLNPPNVKGWVGGTTWIDAKTLLERRKHLSWMGWDLHNDGRQRVPQRLDAVLTDMLFAAPPYDAAALAVPPTHWDPRGEYIRRLLMDPALHVR
ncbi:MAG: DUF1800 domain-containing protein [Planctomycetes bacterium]|nr:DUF1800 domain-containing protein [Planctomycetota bacterium]